MGKRSSPMIGSRCFREPVSLDCELHKCFSVYFSSSFRRHRMARAGGGGDFPSPGSLVQRSYPSRPGSGYLVSPEGGRC